MSNQLSPFKMKVAIALKVETVAKLDKRAKLDNTSRAAVAEYFLATALEHLQLSPEEQAQVCARIEENKKKKGRG